MDVKQGFFLATGLTPASHHDSPFCVSYSCHNLKVTRTKEPIKTMFADKEYFEKPNREFLAMNKIENGIMCLKGTRRIETTGAELTESETKRNKAISRVRYIVEQYYCFLTN